MAWVQEDTKATSQQNPQPPAKPESWDHLTVGGGVVPEGAKKIMREETGQVLFEGTAAVPLIHYETSVAALRTAEVEPQLWLAKDVEHEHLTIKNWTSTGNTKTLEDAEKKKAVPGPVRKRLLRLPDWGAPNGWDFWDRPWAYVDAPNRPKETGFITERHPRVACMMIATLVNCPHERQYLPDMDVAWSAAMAAVWVIKRGRIIDSSGNLTQPARNSDHENQAHRLLPRHYGRDSNAAVWQQLRTWATFQRLGTGRRENPPMPEGDVTLTVVIGLT